MLQNKFPSHKHIIENVQNVNSMCMIISTTYLYFADSMDYCYNIIFTYLIIDLMFSQTESTIHHILILLMLTCKQAYGYSDADVNIIIKPFIKTEISTFFLTLKILYEDNVNDALKKTKIATIVDALFLITFTKTRMWDLLRDTILNPEMHQIIQPPLQDSIIRNVHFHTGFYGIYLLNLYWFVKILKKVYKDVVVKTQHAWLNTQAIAEEVLPWTMFLSANLHFVGSWNLVGTWDLVGTIMLSIASYIYHGRKRDIFRSGKDVLVVNNILVDGMNNAVNDVSTEFFFDAAAIHLKSFLSLIAIGSNRGSTSAMIHILCFFASKMYATQQVQVVYHLHETHTSSITFINVMNACVIVPTLYDLTHIIAETDDIVIKTQIGMTIVAIGVVLKLKPLYNLNHIVVHILVIMQSWAIASAIIAKNATH